MDKKMFNIDTGKTLVTDLQRADTFWARFLGLLPYSSLPEGHGMLLTPCSSVHTFFMRFKIDVLYLDEYYRILRVYEGVKPWRALFPYKKTKSVLELPAGTVAVTLTEEGHRLAYLPK